MFTAEGARFYAAWSCLEIKGSQASHRPSSVRSIGNPQLLQSAL